MNAPPATTPTFSCRPVGASAAPDLLAVNRACPLVSDFTFRFDRDPDFFAWPSRVFESFTYVGAHADDRIVGYGSVGWRTGWTGAEWGPWVYFGDLRVLPEYRGERLGWSVSEALIETLPPQVKVGYFIVKKGNRTAEQIAQKFRSRSLSYRSGGILDVVNVPLVRASGPRTTDGCRAARAADAPDIAELLRGSAANRLFAPRLEADGLAALWDGFERERVMVAERAGRLAGVIAWRDFTDVRRATVLHYSRRSWPMRAAWGLAQRRNSSIAALPKPGEALRVLVATHLAARGDDPGVLRTLILGAMHAEAGRGTHLLQVAGMRGEGVLRAVRRLLRLHFSSEVWVASRPAHDPIIERALQRRPWIDLAII